MYKLEDYKQFLSFLSEEGIDIEYYINEFSKIIDAIDNIRYLFCREHRFKFSKSHIICGLEVLGLLFEGETYDKVYMAVPSNDSLGFKRQKIPYDLNFVQELYNIVKSEYQILNNK